MSFEKLNLVEPILKALSESGYNKPTLIQTRAIPLALKRKDLLVVAPSRTGKTEAFNLPIIQLIHKFDVQKNALPVIRALIICPDKKQVEKVENSLNSYSKYTSIKLATLSGGLEQEAQVENIKEGVNILVGTPRRILKAIEKNKVSLSEVKMLVLSEAHRMMKRDFIQEVEDLLVKVPEKRHTMIFSGKLSNGIQKLSGNLLNDYEKIELEPSELPKNAGKGERKDRDRDRDRSKGRGKKKDKRDVPLHERKRGAAALPSSLRKKFRWPLG